MKYLFIGGPLCGKLRTATTPRYTHRTTHKTGQRVRHHSYEAHVYAGSTNRYLIYVLQGAVAPTPERAMALVREHALQPHVADA